MFLKIVRRDVAPTGPNGNCKVIQKDGAEKRECYYGCPNPTLEGGDTKIVLMTEIVIVVEP